CFASLGGWACAISVVRRSSVNACILSSFLTLRWGPPPPRAHKPCALRRDLAAAGRCNLATSGGGHPHELPCPLSLVPCSTPRCCQRRGAPEQHELPLTGIREVRVQVHVRGVSLQRAPTLVDRLIDRGEVLLQHSHGFRIQLRALGLECALEIGDGLVVMPIREVSGNDLIRVNLR